MNNTKKINVNFSSLVGLKAELLRKQIEVKDAKTKIDPPTLNLPKVKVKNKSNKKNVVIKDEKEKSQKVTEIEDVNMLKKSKYMLEAKSRLYDKLKKNHGDSDHQYLVDFENKSESEDEIYKEEDYEDTNSDPEEDWVEYEDCFGRTRKCLRRDLPRMKDKDNLVKKEVIKQPPEVCQKQEIEQKVIIQPEKEPEIEMMRKKWEKQTERLAQKSDIHYQDLLFDEARAHGVGYYSFSQDDAKRAQQQANLAKLRAETEQTQKELQEIKELKSKMEENRLKAARIRQRTRAGLPPEPDVEEETEEINKSISLDDSDTQIDTVIPSSDVIEVQDSKESDDKNNSLMVIEDKIKAFGELLGKRPKWRELSQAEWIEKRRKDRHGEFAPFYDNFKSAGFMKQFENNKDHQLVAKEDDSNDPLRISGNGPEPTDIWESSGAVKNDQNTSANNEANKCEAEQFNPTHNHDVKSNVKELSPNQQTSSTNYTEFPFPVFPVPPPIFDASIPPPSIISSIPSLPIINPPVVNTNYIATPYSQPPSLFGASLIDQPLLNQSTWNSNVTNIENTLNIDNSTEASDPLKDSNDETDSDSNIIGPMPPASIINSNEDVSLIPLPSDCSSKGSKHKEIETPKKEQKNLNVDKIAAGLKYLRQQFDNVHNS